jgi:hypothetical protein
MIEVHIDQASTNDLAEYLKRFNHNVNKAVGFDHVKDVAYLKLRR